ncbi:NADPH-dependent ferric siderophore reductase [Photobacterium jeanii]|uniref:NADPH-dependent ferric siderophore reductase n=1 Tax=Photobacterium jeanii TaxID=858640 RepID=A0A178K4L4_9GAMM|nr:siderophore-interacting protein [Photobacterium jeanii]OAN11633.1 NADPH-dependent ferric siderophore reductase [Photobacterium jeanii]PST91155.1 siderophore-interacting protein [Photobacterium jeanii]
MKKPSPKQLTVSDSQRITPNMQRIMLQGDELADFPQDCEGGYIKLLFTPAGNTDLGELDTDQRPVMRTYTIRRFLPNSHAIEVDFVRHITHDLQCGFAARWAMEVSVGDTINIAGPGTISSLNMEADWFFLTADMTALPALSAKIRQLPMDAKGYAVIKVIDSDDIQSIEAPENIQVMWLTGNESLEDKVKSLPWLEGKVSVWSACEFDSMRALRRYFRNEKEVDRENIYISSYWKQGVAEDGHKVIKQQDAQENA